MSTSKQPTIAITDIELGRYKYQTTTYSNAGKNIMNKLKWLYNEYNLKTVMVGNQNS